MTAIDLAGRAGSYRPPRQGRYTPTAGMRKSTAASLRKLAGHIESRHPDLGAHEHINDAARALDRGQTDAANRHLTAAVGNLTPQSLRRHGLLADDQHDAAKRSMDAVHRHMLLIKDIADLHQQNSQLPYASDPADEPGIADDSLDDKPTARLGNVKAMNAPGKPPTGGPDASTAKPQQVTGSSTKQVAASIPAGPALELASLALEMYSWSGDLTTSVDLATAYRYRHGWIKIAPGQADAVRATASKIEARRDPGSAQAGMHLRQAAGLMDQGELSERGHEEVRTHLAQAADFRPDMTGEVQGHIARLDSAGKGMTPPDVGHQPGDKSSDTPLRTALGRLNLFGRVLPAANKIMAANEAPQPVDLAFHFNPLEKRGAHGEWTKDDEDKTVKKIMKAYPSDRDGYSAQGGFVSSMVRSGHLHNAVKQLDEDAASGRYSSKSGDLKEAADSLRSARTSDPRYVHEMEAENGTEPDPGVLADASNKDNKELEEDLGLRSIGRDDPRVSFERGEQRKFGTDPQVAEAARRELMDRTILGNYRPPQVNPYAGSRPDLDITQHQPSAERASKAWADLNAQFQKVRDKYPAPTGLPAPGSAEDMNIAAFANVYLASGGYPCPECGTVNAPDARYCKRCRHAVQPSMPYDHFATEDVTCTNCGRGDDADATFCDQCGERMQGAAVAVGMAVEMSAQTGALASTPHPFGKPGGPGLWGVKGMELPPYVQNIAHALLREGRAKDEGQAIAMARAATKRWLHGRNVHPEVRAAAAGADADWRAKQAVAHSHANDPEAIEMTFNAAELRGPRGEWIKAAAASQLRAARDRQARDEKARRLREHQRAQVVATLRAQGGRKLGLPPVDTVPPGQPSSGRLASSTMSGGYSAENWRGAGRASRMVMSNYQPALDFTGTSAGAAKDSRTPLGTFGSGSSSSTAQGGKPPAKGGKTPPPKGKPQPQPPAKKGPDAHQQHVAHEKAQIAGQIAGNNHKIGQLMAQKRAMLAALASAGGKTSSGQSGSKTSSNATTASNAAASSKAAASTASTASSAASSTASTAKSAASSASSASQSTAQISAQIAAVNGQIAALRAANAQLAAKAAALK